MKPTHMKSNKTGFTLIEVLMVIAIIGVLATIAIGVVFSMLERGYIKTLETDLHSAYKTAVSYHVDNPDGTVTVDSLKEYGHRESPQVVLTIADGTQENLLITGTHPRVSGVYKVDSTGNVSKQ